MADVHRGGPRPVTRVWLARARGVEKRVEVTPGVEHVAPDESIDRVGELCALFVGQTVGPERRPEPVK